MKRLKNYTQFLNELKSDRVMSASDLLKQDYKDNLKLSGKWNDIIGDIAPDFTMMVTGAPGSGKTTFLLEFAYYLASDFGKVFYISSEEYGSVTLADKLEQIIKDKGLHSDDDKSLVPKNLFFGKGFADLQDYDFVIIDSVTELNTDLQDFKEIRDIYPSKGFIVVLQSIKGVGKGSEKYRGSKEWEHECDIVLGMKNGYIQMYKNRYGDMKCYDYFKDKVIKCDNQKR